MLLTRLAVALIALSSFTSTLEAAEPEFKAARVVESRSYDRDKASVVVGGFRTPAVTETASRVTVLIEGTRITGEWEPKTSLSTTAKDFPRGSEVEVAVERNRLLLKHIDGIVTAKIVKRVEQDDEDERRN
jgi:hypothetical protein